MPDTGVTCVIDVAVAELDVLLLVLVAALVPDIGVVVPPSVEEGKVMFEIGIPLASAMLMISRTVLAWSLS